jgi:hypothetical protein
MIETQRAWLLWPCLCVHAEEKIDLFRNYTFFNVDTMLGSKKCSNIY